jgi:hypothetical protein
MCDDCLSSRTLLELAFIRFLLARQKSQWAGTDQPACECYRVPHDSSKLIGWFWPTGISVLQEGILDFLICDFGTEKHYALSFRKSIKFTHFYRSLGSILSAKFSFAACSGFMRPSIKLCERCRRPQIISQRLLSCSSRNHLFNVHVCSLI